MTRRKPSQRILPASERLLVAAAQVYAARGSHAMTVEDILSSAEVSRPTFYKCFTDKHAAIEAVVRDSNAALRAALDAAVTAAPDAESKIAAGLDAYLDWGLSQGRFATRLYSEMALPESIAGQERQRTVTALAEMVLREMKTLELPKDVLPPDPLLLSAVMQGVESLGSALFSKPRLIGRARVRALALTLLAAALPLPVVAG